MHRRVHECCHRTHCGHTATCLETPSFHCPTGRGGSPPPRPLRVCTPTSVRRVQAALLGAGAAPRVPGPRCPRQRRASARSRGRAAAGAEAAGSAQAPSTSHLPCPLLTLPVTPEPPEVGHFLPFLTLTPARLKRTFPPIAFQQQDVRSSRCTAGDPADVRLAQGWEELPRAGRTLRCDRAPP